MKFRILKSYYLHNSGVVLYCQICTHTCVYKYMKYTHTHMHIQLIHEFTHRTAPFGSMGVLPKCVKDLALTPSTIAYNGCVCIAALSHSTFDANIICIFCASSHFMMYSVCTQTSNIAKYLHNLNISYT